jgi:prepilin-type N-terminal cleavage/methylation domain-containing protein
MFTTKKKRDFFFALKIKQEVLMINLKNKNSLQKQKGVTLIEVLAVVIIGVLIIVGAFTLYGNAQSKQNENATMTGIMAIQANVRDLFYGQGYDDVDNDTMVNASGIPSSFQVDESTTPFTITHPLGGDVSVSTGDTSSEFGITVGGVPQATCITMAGRNSGFLEVTVNGNAVENSGEAAGSCTDPEDGTGNTIIYTSR